MAKRGRPRKHQTQEEAQKAANAASRASRQRRKASQLHSQPASHDSLWVEFDPLSMLQQAGAEGDATVTAPDRGIQAEGLDIPAEGERLQILEVDEMPWIEQVHVETEEGVQHRASPAREPLSVELSAEPLALETLLSLPNRPVLSEKQSSSQLTQEAGAVAETDGEGRQAGVALQALEASEALEPVPEEAPEETLKEAVEESLEIVSDPPPTEPIDIAANILRGRKHCLDTLNIW